MWPGIGIGVPHIIGGRDWDWDCQAPDRRGTGTGIPLTSEGPAGIGIGQPWWAQGTARDWDCSPAEVTWDWDRQAKFVALTASPNQGLCVSWPQTPPRHSRHRLDTGQTPLTPVSIDTAQTRLRHCSDTRLTPPTLRHNRAQEPPRGLPTYSEAGDRFSF